jgi:hypothetical protein
VNALLLLGDNFYPKGLRRRVLLRRLADNVAHPFCRFLVLAEPEPPELSDACPPAERRHPVPIYAVLGNHDHNGDSPALQREEVARHLPDWQMEPGTVGLVELAPGLSLVLVDSTEVQMADDAGPLRDALARSAGPWRIVAQHHPLRGDAISGKIRAAIADSGVPVQLLLAGHEHSLQLRDPPPPGPALEVVSGAGSDVDPVEPGGPPRRFVSDRAGFVRVDLVPDDEGGRLVVSVLTVSPRFITSFGAPRLAARWSVGLDGRVRNELE